MTNGLRATTACRSGLPIHSKKRIGSLVVTVSLVGLSIILV